MRKKQILRIIAMLNELKVNDRNKFQKIDYIIDVLQETLFVQANRNKLVNLDMEDKKYLSEKDNSQIGVVSAETKIPHTQYEFENQENSKDSDEIFIGRIPVSRKKHDE